MTSSREDLRAAHCYTELTILKHNMTDMLTIWGHSGEPGITLSCKHRLAEHCNRHTLLIDPDFCQTIMIVAGSWKRRLGRTAALWFLVSSTDSVILQFRLSMKLSYTFFSQDLCVLRCCKNGVTLNRSPEAPPPRGAGPPGLPVSASAWQLPQNKYKQFFKSSVTR